MANLHTLQVRPVSASAGSQVFPAVSGQVIVWVAEAGGRQRLYGRDLTTGRGFAPFYRSQLQLSASISGPIVVWAEASPTPPDAWAIVGANIRTGRTFVVTTSAQQPPTCHETPRGIVPLIGGRIVLWTRACGAESFAIEAKDLATGRTFEVARLPADRLNPQFGPHLAFDGRIVVWDQARHGRFTTADDVDIYAEDIVTGRQLRVTRDPGPHAWPAISGHIVVWTSGRAIRGALLSA